VDNAKERSRDMKAEQDTTQALNDNTLKIEFEKSPENLGVKLKITRLIDNTPVTHEYVIPTHPDGHFDLKSCLAEPPSFFSIDFNSNSDSLW